MLLALLSSTALVRAQNATWIGTAGPPNNWNTAANWQPTPSGPPAFVPVGTAFFNSSLLPTTSIEIAGSTTVGGMTFTNAPGYNFSVPAGGTFILNGAGVVVDAGSAAPTFSIVSGTMALINSATAGRSVIDVNGLLALANTSNAGSALITNDGTINFQDGSSAGSATIFNNATRFINFSQSGGPLSATAGNATIDNSGTMVFWNTSTAGNSSITTRSGGSTFFINQSSAGASQQTVASGGTLTFLNGASAGSSTIGSSGTVNFNDASSAGTALITNNTGGFLFFNQAAAGSASAANSTIENSGNLAFFSTSTAANATIITQPGGTTTFLDQSTGGTSSIVINSNGISSSTVNISAITDPTFTIGSLAGTGNAPFAQFLIGSKNLIVGGNNQSTSYAGLVFDSGAGGSLTKVGTGTLTLAGAASYTGSTSILGGELNIGPGASLQSTSSILVGPNGTLSGNGTITTAGTTTVNGTLAPTSGGGTPLFLTSNLILNSTATYRATIGNGALGFAVVTGAVTLGGALQVQIGANGLNFGTPYTVLQSTQNLNQQFDTATGPGAFTMQVIYNAQNVQVSFAPDLANFASTGNTNQQATAGALQTGLTGGGVAAPFLPLFSMDRPTYLSALSQLSGEIATGGSTAGLKTMDLFLNHMINPFLDARGSGPQGPSLAFGPEAAQEDESAEALGYKRRKTTVANQATQAFAQLRRPEPRDERRFNTWAAGYGGWAKTEGQASAGSAALDSRVGGIAMGLDYRPSFNTVFGIAVGAAKTSYGLADNLGNGDADVAQVGVHGAIRLNNTYLSAAFAYGWHSVSTSRTVALLSTDPIKGNYDAHSVNGRVEIGSRSGSANFGVTPFAAAQFQRYFAPAYEEQATGGGVPFALSYNASSTNALRSELGVWFDARPAQEIRLRSRIAWAHQFADAPIATAAFTSIPSGPFVVTGARVGRDALLASVAADWAVQQGIALNARFDTEQARGGSSYSGMGGVRFTW